MAQKTEETKKEKDKKLETLDEVFDYLVELFGG